ncbi:MAG: BON domain-containing protein [Rhizobium sp.]|nr:MAG: BON domain-containing protein [Rhizobium sp.]
MQKRNSKPLSREEDYRDYEERDQRTGWPYSDGRGNSTFDPENKGYGSTQANFDEQSEFDFIVDDANETGQEEDTARTLPDGTDDRIANDELEAAITDWLERNDDIDINAIEVRVDGGVVTLEGSVETIAISRRVETELLSFRHVKHVRNNLRTIAVDSHIPPDA